ncbi:MAG: FitA-like ribbon-helix-helix domain-containing protein [Alphaproteobacteria bacterium]
MGTITVRNLDDAVIDRLKKRARDNERSLEAEVRALLTEVSARPSRRKFVEMADRIATMTPDVSQTDSTELLREDRNR